MSKYQLHQPANQKEVERNFIQARIDLLSEKQWSLSGEDFKRYKLTIDYNQRLLDNPNATVSLRASR